MKTPFKIPASKQLKTKIPGPRAKPAKPGLFAHVSAPKQDALKTRIYTKDVIKDDPSEFSSFGFGNTGLENIALKPGGAK